MGTKQTNHTFLSTHLNSHIFSQALYFMCFVVHNLQLATILAQLETQSCCLCSRKKIMGCPTICYGHHFLITHFDFHVHQSFMGWVYNVCIEFNNWRRLICGVTFDSVSSLSSSTTKAFNFSFLEESLALCGPLQMKQTHYLSYLHYGGLLYHLC